MICSMLLDFRNDPRSNMLSYFHKIITIHPSTLKISLMLRTLPICGNYDLKGPLSLHHRRLATQTAISLGHLAYLFECPSKLFCDLRIISHSNFDDGLLKLHQCFQVYILFYNVLFQFVNVISFYNCTVIVWIHSLQQNVNYLFICRFFLIT